MVKLYIVLVALVLLVCSAGTVGAASSIQYDQLIVQAGSTADEDAPLLQGTSYRTITLGQSFYASWRWYYYPSGRPVTGRYASLQSSYNGGSWKTLKGGTTNSNGVVGWTIKPTAVGTYRYRTAMGSVVGKDILSVTVKKSTAAVTGVCEFAGSPTSGSKPLTVRFYDRSTGSPKSWSWTFGDGTTSTAKNPVHKYTRTGKFSVKLTVKYANGATRTKTRWSYITVR